MIPLEQLERGMRVDGISRLGTATIETAVLLPDDRAKVRCAIDNGDEVAVYMLRRSDEAALALAQPSAEDAPRQAKGPPPWIEWPGRKDAEMGEYVLEQLHAQIDLAKTGQWDELLELIGRDSQARINFPRPGGRSRYSILHHAAYLGAPVDVVEKLLARGCSRMLRNARGETPRDVALRKKHNQLAGPLTPTLRWKVAPYRLRALQIHLHSLMIARAGEGLFSLPYDVILPELEVLQDLEWPEMFSYLPGLHGTFRYRLVFEDEPDLGPVSAFGESRAPYAAAPRRAHLWTDSNCKFSDGSGRRHLVSMNGYRLIEKEVGVPDDDGGFTSIQTGWEKVEQAPSGFLVGASPGSWEEFR